MYSTCETCKDAQEAANQDVKEQRELARKERVRWMRASRYRGRRTDERVFHKAVIKSLGNQSTLLKGLVLFEDGAYIIPRSELVYLGPISRSLGRSRPGRPSPGFAAAWAKWAGSPITKPRPEPFDNDTLLCKHQRLCVDLDKESENPRLITTVPEKEWNILQESYGGGARIRVWENERGSPSRYVANPTVCDTCLEEG